MSVGQIPFGSTASYWIGEMHFDEAVLRATNGEQLEPTPF